MESNKYDSNIDKDNEAAEHIIDLIDTLINTPIIPANQTISSKPKPTINQFWTIGQKIKSILTRQKTKIIYKKYQKKILLKFMEMKI